MRSLPPLALRFLVAGVGACSDGAETTAPLTCEYDQEVVVTVELAVRPRFTWTPGCGMASVLVVGGGGGWVIYSGADAADNPIGPGVVYGIAPPGTLEPSPATPLQSGEEYSVTVYRWIGEPGGPGSLFPQGSANFQTP